MNIKDKFINKGAVMKKVYLLSVLFIMLISCSRKTVEERVYTENTYITESEITSSESAGVEIRALNNETDYNNGNGTILERKILNGKNWIITKHETENKEVGWETFNAYENLGEKNGEVLFVLRDRMIVSTLEIAYAEERKNNFELWIKIKNNQGNIGWIKTNGYYNPYHDGTWAIIEIIELNGNISTVRKLEQGLETTTRLNVRDKPGLAGNILFQLNSGTYIETLGIVEEIKGNL
ncbi:MAG: hypothetical protein LBQ69_06665 [Treponema sp.]|jgi:hypothetical protein|nr:hypothetical protein [Treponema sp.]